MITNIAQPYGKYVTGYNPVVFVADSTNKNLEGFRYIYNVYSAGTSDLLASYKIAPRINDGYGVLSCEKVLQSFLSYDFNQDSTAPIPNSWVAFDVKIGESYGAFWNYSGFGQYVNTGSTYNGYVVLSGGTAHPYLPGDQINVTPNPLVDYFPAIGGLHTVILSASSTSVVLDIPLGDFIASGITGTTTFANNTRALYPDLYSFTSGFTSGMTAFNGAVPFVDKFFNQDEYIMSGFTSAKKFLTTAPSGIYKRRGEDMYFNIINNYSGSTSGSVYMYIQTSNGGLYRWVLNNNTNPLIQMPVGPASVSGTTLAGSLPVIQSGTTYYDIWIGALPSPSQIISEIFRINIDDRCPIDYDDEEVSICFLDRLGSFGSFAFPMRRYDNATVTRSTYNKQSGYVNNGAWDYSLLDNGTNIYNVDLKRTITLNTDWMEEQDGFYFDELISSPVTFIKWKGVYQRCDVVDTNSERIYHRNKTLIRKTIQVNFSNQDNVNI